MYFLQKLFSSLFRFLFETKNHIQEANTIQHSID